MKKEDYFNNIAQRLDAEIDSEDANSRMLDLLFDKQFLATCSWSGRGKTENKHTFSGHTNIMRLFQVIATNHYGTKVDYAYVETYIHGKLIRAPARKHINILLLLPLFGTTTVVGQGLPAPTSEVSLAFSDLLLP